MTTDEVRGATEADEAVDASASAPCAGVAGAAGVARPRSWRRRRAEAGIPVAPRVSAAAFVLSLALHAGIGVLWASAQPWCVRADRGGADARVVSVTNGGTLDATAGLSAWSPTPERADERIGARAIEPPPVPPPPHVVEHDAVADLASALATELERASAARTPLDALTEVAELTELALEHDGASAVRPPFDAVAFLAPSRPRDEVAATPATVDGPVLPSPTLDAPALPPRATDAPALPQHASDSLPPQAEDAPIPPPRASDAAAASPRASVTSATTPRATVLPAQPPPRYPRWARDRGQEGIVALQVDVDARGRAVSVVVTRSSGHPVLDDAARDAVRAWRFEPARAGGVPVPSRTDVTIRFELMDRRG